MTSPFQDMMNEATRLTRSGQLLEATRLIQQALAASSAVAGVASTPEPRAAAMNPSSGLPGLAGWPDAGRASAKPAPGPGEMDRRDEHPADRDDGGHWLSGRTRVGSLSREYRLYQPPARFSGRRALVVMLHGCTQDPDDFSRGTGWNTLAGGEGLFVLYPAQSAQANPSRCWNWFKHTHQGRDRGECGLIAAMTRELIAAHPIDPSQVFVAGLSAGGAMAANLASAYPELFRGLGVHSGLAPCAATDLNQALALMKSGPASAGQGTSGPLPRVAAITVPTIVFHGDLDTVVHPANGEAIIRAAQAGTAALGAGELIDQARSPAGRHFTRITQADSQGRPWIEHWRLHGAGHAWSGGSAAGSFTDPAGPDASREMLRFFRSLTPRSAG